MANILIIDDEQYVCDFVSEVFSDLGHDVKYALRFSEGREMVARYTFDVVFLDVRLPDGNGLDLLPEIRQGVDPPEVIIITGYGDPQGAALAINNDAWDYIEKSTSPDKLTLTLNRVLQFRESRQKQSLPRILKLEGIVGGSGVLKTCLESLAGAADTNANVLITGETGTGKELFANAVHQNSNRSERPFVIVDCASLPESLIESVLFGHDKGAFTGADRARTGLVKMADKGTLFLDEVGELPLSMQKKFLRVLESRRFRPIGARNEEESDFKLVSATHRDLNALVKEGRFREDLLYRLRSLTIQIPPLREHKEDIKELCIYHMNLACDNQGVAGKGFDPEVFKALACHDWPGNIRELVNVIDELFVSARCEPVIYPWHLPKLFRVRLTQSRVLPDNGPAVKTACQDSPGALPTWREFKRLNELQYLRHLMAMCNGNVAEASQRSGIGRSQLYALIEKHGIHQDADQQPKA